MFYIRDFWKFIFCRRKSTLRFLIPSGIGGGLTTWAGFLYNNRHIPPWFPVFILLAGGIFLAFMARQIAFNYNKHKFANYWFCGVLIAYSCLAAFDLYFEYFRVREMSPQFVLLSAPVGSLDSSAGSISLASISHRRIRVLRIINPNSFSISTEFAMQFPEAILSVSPDEGLISFPILDGLPKVGVKGPPVKVRVNGFITTNLIVEPFATNETTGLRRFRLKRVPPADSFDIQFSTIAGSDSGIFGAGVASNRAWLEAGESVGEYAWFIAGGYRNADEPESALKKLFIPVHFNWTNRDALLSQNIWTVSVTKIITLRQGCGVRIPGLCETEGYLSLMRIEGSNFAFRIESPWVFRRESLDSMPFVTISRIGGNGILSIPTQIIQFTNGTEVTIGQ